MYRESSGALADGGPRSEGRGLGALLALWLWLDGYRLLWGCPGGGFSRF